MWSCRAPAASSASARPQRRRGAGMAGATANSRCTPAAPPMRQPAPATPRQRLEPQVGGVAAHHVWAHRCAAWSDTLQLTGCLCLWWVEREPWQCACWCQLVLMAAIRKQNSLT